MQFQAALAKCIHSLSPGKVVSYGKAAERCAVKYGPLSVVQDTRRLVCSRSGFWDAEGCALEETCSPGWLESPSAEGLWVTPAKVVSNLEAQDEPHVGSFQWSCGNKVIEAS